MTAPTTSTFRNLEDFAGIASDWFWETDQAHRFTYLSNRMEEVTKLNTAEILGRTRMELAGQATDAEWQTHLDDLAARRPFRAFEFKVTRPADGSVLWLRTAGVPRFDSSGQFIGYRGTGHDITREKMTITQLEQSNAALAVRNRELQEARQALEQAAYHDTLTHLPNRRAFEQALEQALETAEGKLALLHLDLDRFKWVNDTLGHPSGDVLLTTAAQRISTTVGDDGRTYRVGGDEFMVLLTRGVTRDLATRTGNAIVEIMKTPIDVGQRQVTVGVSVGIVLSVAGQDDPATTIMNADVALYEAKRNGRNRICLISPQIITQIQARRQIATSIPAALQRGEFIAFFQPQADLLSGNIIGAEALVRWCHPDLGLLKPAAFLELAAEIGLIEEIDRMMLRLALDAVRRLGARGVRLPSVSVNISAPRLMDPRLPEDVATCWNPGDCRLVFELLETIYFDDRRENPLITTNLQRLRAMGVELLIDDFGSGRASITGLLKVRPDRLKIERSLIRAAVTDPQQRQAVAAILEMTRALGIEAMAEGADGADDIAVVGAIGCRYYQGDALAPVLTEEEFAAFLSSRQIGPKTKTAGHDDLPLCV